MALLGSFGFASSCWSFEAVLQSSDSGLLHFVANLSAVASTVEPISQDDSPRTCLNLSCQAYSTEVPSQSLTLAQIGQVPETLSFTVTSSIVPVESAKVGSIFIMSPTPFVSLHCLEAWCFHRVEIANLSLWRLTLELPLLSVLIRKLTKRRLYFLRHSLKLYPWEELESQLQ